MALAVSDYLADAWLNQAFRNIAWTRPSTVYIALYTSNPTGADTGAEVTGGSYARRPITFGAPITEGGKRTIKNNAELVFPTATAYQGTVTHIGIRDALTGGNLLFYGEAENPRSILVNDVAKWPINSVVLTLN